MNSRRRYDAGYGVKTLDALSVVVAFFEERRGRLHGFRWRDRLDHSSTVPAAAVTPLDQAIGIGDGTTATFALAKTYGQAYAPYPRPIVKPVTGTADQADHRLIHADCSGPALLPAYQPTGLA